MSATNTIFKSERAPCGQVVDGEHYQDLDDEALVTDHLRYACGCRSIRHEYHDGSISCKVIRHDGKVLTDEHRDEHQA
jgi:membrane-bound inhibitor of C-type lysozyme